MILAIATFNLLIAAIRLYQTLKQRRLICIAWFLIAYFSVFFLPVSMETELLHFRGFTAETISVKGSSIDRTLIFVLAFNLIFLLGESVASAILRCRGMSGNQVWVVSASDPYYKKLELCFVVVLVIG